MSNILLVNCTQYKSAYYVVDLVNRQCKPISKETITKVNSDKFNIETQNYSGDLVSICDSYGTLAYVNTEYNFYGILKERNKGVGIIWVSKENAEKDEKFNSLCNRCGELLDITSEGLAVFDNSWKKGFKSSILSDSLRQFPCKREIFDNSLGINIEAIEDSEDEQLNIAEYTTETEEKSVELEELLIENVDDAVVENVDNTYSNVKEAVIEENKYTKRNEEVNLVNKDTAEENKCETKKNKSESSESLDESISKDMFKAYMKDIESRLIEVSKREEEVTKRETELAEAYNKINGILDKADTYSVNSIVDTLVDVDLVVNNSTIVDNTFDCADHTWEMILKMLHIDDHISIPFDFYRKLKPLVKRSLEQTKNGLIYKLLAEIYFNKTSNENLVVIIDCDETIKKVTLHILKPYNKDKMLDYQINDFLIKYASWRKNVMTTKE